MNIKEYQEIFKSDQATFYDDRANLLVYRTFDDIEKDLFNDKILINDNRDQVHEFVCTANAGTWATNNIKSWGELGYRDKDGNKLDVSGGGHFRAGWTGEIFRFGYHHNEYPALVQFRPSHLYADNGTFDRDQWSLVFVNGNMNIHFAAGKNNLIGHGSYGCIAIKDPFNGQGPWSKFFEALESFPQARKKYYGVLIIDF